MVKKTLGSFFREAGKNPSRGSVKVYDVTSVTKSGKTGKRIGLATAKSSAGAAKEFFRKSKHKKQKIRVFATNLKISKKLEKKYFR